MRKSVPYIVGFVVILAGVVKWRAYEHPNALQLGVTHLGLAYLLVIWGFSGQRHKTPSVRRRRSGHGWAQPNAILAAYALWVALSPGWAEHATLGFVGASALIPYLVWALVLGALLKDAPQRATCLILMGLAAGVLAAFTFYDALIGHEEWLNQRQGHQNMLATCLLGGVFAAAGGLVGVGNTRLGPKLRMTVRVALGLSLLAGLGLLVPARSTGAWVGLAAGVAIAALGWLPTRIRRPVIGGAVTAVAVALLMLPHVPKVADSLWARILVSEQATRLFHIESSLHMVSERPLLGWGAGNFMSSFAQFKLPEAALLGWQTMLTIHPHNEAALIATELGAVGLLLFALFCAGVLLLGWESNGSPRERWLTLAALGGFAAILTHSMFEVILGFWGPAAFFWTHAGLMLSQAPTGPAPSPALRRLRTPASVGGAIVLLGLVTLPGQRAHYLMGKAEDLAHVEGQAERRVALYDRARPLSRYAPQYIRTYIWPARALHVAGESERAIAAFERLDEVAPNLGACRWILGQQYYRRYVRHRRSEDLRRAVENLESYTRVRPDNSAAQTLYARALIEVSTANAPRAATALLTALWLHPSDEEARDLLERTRPLRGFGPAEP